MALQSDLEWVMERILVYGIGTVITAGSAGAWLRWCVIPIVAAYEIGRRIERLSNARQETARRRIALSARQQRPVGSSRRPGVEERQARPPLLRVGQPGRSPR